MNILQSFMGCMYPGSIRTESIESMDNDYPDCRYQVTNIDERGNEVSQGELQLTDRDLIYFRPSRFPTRWPIDYIRRYGCTDQGNIFIFESGRRCQTGQAIFAFRLGQASELVRRLKEKIEKFPRDEFTMNDVNDQIDNNVNSSIQQHLQKVPFTTNQQAPQICSTELMRVKKRDASTSTDINLDQADLLILDDHQQTQDADPRPLSYALIDFNTTKALNESAQAHAASRVK